MSESEMFRTSKGFNTDYFKIGQLIKITVQNFQEMFIEIDYGFITQVRFDKIVFFYIEADGEQKEKTITPMDLFQNELDINIEIISEKARTTGR